MRNRAHLYILWREHYRLGTLTRRILTRTTHMATMILIITLKSIRIDTIQCLLRMNCQGSVEKDQQQPKSNRTGNAIRRQPLCQSRSLCSSPPCSWIHHSSLITHCQRRAAPTCRPTSSRAPTCRLTRSLQRCMAAQSCQPTKEARRNLHP